MMVRNFSSGVWSSWPMSGLNWVRACCFRPNRSSAVVGLEASSLAEPVSAGLLAGPSAGASELELSLLKPSSELSLLLSVASVLTSGRFRGVGVFAGDGSAMKGMVGSTEVLPSTASVDASELAGGGGGGMSSPIGSEALPWFRMEDVSESLGATGRLAPVAGSTANGFSVAEEPPDAGDGVFVSSFWCPKIIPTP